MNKKKALYTSLAALALASSQAQTFADEVNTEITEPTVTADAPVDEVVETPADTPEEQVAEDNSITDTPADDTQPEETPAESEAQPEETALREAASTETEAHHTLKASVVPYGTTDDAVELSISYQADGKIPADNRYGSSVYIDYELVDNETGAIRKTGGNNLYFDEVKATNTIYLSSIPNGEYTVNLYSNEPYKSKDGVLHYYTGETAFSVVDGKFKPAGTAAPKPEETTPEETTAPAPEETSSEDKTANSETAQPAEATPAKEESPVADETPAKEESPVADDTPAETPVEETPKTETPAVEETANNTPASEETAPEASKEETPSTEAAPYVGTWTNGEGNTFVVAADGTVTFADGTTAQGKVDGNNFIIYAGPYVYYNPSTDSFVWIGGHFDTEEAKQKGIYKRVTAETGEEETKETITVPVTTVSNKDSKAPAIVVRGEESTVPQATTKTAKTTATTPSRSEKVQSGKGFLPSTGEAVSILGLVGAGLSALGLVGLKRRRK